MALKIRSKTHFLCGALLISVPLCAAKELFHRETQRRLREARRKSPESNLSAAFPENDGRIIQPKLRRHTVHHGFVDRSSNPVADKLGKEIHRDEELTW